MFDKFRKFYSKLIINLKVSNLVKSLMFEGYGIDDRVFYDNIDLYFNSNLESCRRTKFYLSDDLIEYLYKYNMKNTHKQQRFVTYELFTTIADVLLRKFFNYLFNTNNVNNSSGSYFFNSISIFLDYVLNSSAKFVFFSFMKLNILLDSIYMNYDIDKLHQLYWEKFKGASKRYYRRKHKRVKWKRRLLRFFMNYRRFFDYFFVINFLQSGSVKVDGFHSMNKVKFIGLNFYYHLVSIFLYFYV